MPTVKVGVQHSLAREEATRRIQGAIEQARAQFGHKASRVQENWTDDGGEFTIEAMGFRIGGTIQVQTDRVLVNAQIPMAALPWKGKIETAITEQLKSLLS